MVAWTFTSLRCWCVASGDRDSPVKVHSGQVRRTRPSAMRRYDGESAVGLGQGRRRRLSVSFYMVLQR